MIHWSYVRSGDKTIGQFLGDGYGQAVAACRSERAIGKALKRVGLEPDETFVLVTFWHDEERGGRSTNYVKVQTMLEEIEQHKWGDIASVVNVGTLQEAYVGVCEAADVSVVSLLTYDQHEAEQREERRKELEAFASQFAAKHKVGVASLAFIDAVHGEIETLRQGREQWNSGECRAEEWAAHQFAGSTEAYFDDHAYVNGQYSEASVTLKDVLDWLGESCPLLMAQWNERRLATA